MLSLDLQKLPNSHRRLTLIQLSMHVNLKVTDTLECVSRVLRKLMPLLGLPTSDCLGFGHFARL